MTKIISTFIAALCISILLGADAGIPLALKLQGAVVVIVGIGNAIVLMMTLGTLFSQKTREQSYRTWRDTRLPGRFCTWLSLLAWLAAFAWAGWLWSFGIRLLWLLVWRATLGLQAKANE